ncbi:hypothetical protein P3C29_18670 [Pseudomonas sp. 1912-s]|uniref:hypothetical protein n=1 Tax=Pseudomonas sp. 1912-s TaxID=3033802 RepID=UPI0023DEE410|nr:hypothetical protein [Pseudomonas sp. 1912-s]MDF3200713.1 hypothetical protein [Pseudomonas sp. 1912-s]
MPFRNLLIFSYLAVALLLSGCSAPQVSLAPQEPFNLEPLGQPLAQTSARTALIHQILAKDPVVISSQKPVLAPSDNDARIAKLKKADGGTLPEGYWALYKQNLEAMQYDLNHQHDAAREQYVQTYRDELTRADDRTLQVMVTAPKTLDEQTRRQWNARMADRMSQYINTSEQSLRAAADAHINRMALMDRQYNVCARNPECWDAPVKK